MSEISQSLQILQDFDWTVLLGAPLRITAIIVVAFLANLVIRVLIRRFTEHIVRGDAGRSSMVETRGALRRVSDRIIEQDSPQAVQRRRQRAQTVASLLRSLTSIIVTVIATLMVLTELDFNLAPILASAGIVGVAVGFGAQTLVKDYLSGLFLVVEDQFGIGDSIDLGEVSGTVEEVGLRITKVRDVNGTLWYVRNGEILRVGNQSQGWARAVMDVRVPYDSDVDAVQKLIHEAAEELRQDPAWSDQIMEEPEIWGVQALDGEALTVRLVIKTVPLQQWAVARAFRLAVKRKLDAAGIRIPMSE